jgi:hypothetical protein
LQNELDDHLHKDIFYDCTEPKLQDSNFPSLQGQSQVWSLNKEQHNAFLLMGAAMLQHIHFTNQLADSEKNSSITSEIKKLDSFLDGLLLTNRYLRMFLAGSGGTRKSRIIKCFKDFTQRWHLVAATVICASPSVAAMLIEGCTQHWASKLEWTLNVRIRIKSALDFIRTVNYETVGNTDSRIAPDCEKSYFRVFVRRRVSLV